MQRTCKLTSKGVCACVSAWQAPASSIAEAFDTVYYTNTQRCAWKQAMLACSPPSDYSTGGCSAGDNGRQREQTCQIICPRPKAFKTDADDTSYIHYGLYDTSQQMLQERLFTDATLVVEGQAIPVHRAVLAANSPFFKCMLASQMREGDSVDLMECADARSCFTYISLLRAILLLFLTHLYQKLAMHSCIAIACSFSLHASKALPQSKPSLTLRQVMYF